MPYPLPVTRHYIEVLGRQVHYRRRGRGAPVVLLHESPRSSAALLPLMEFGSDQVTMLALDTPGCGDSDPLPLTRPDAGDYADAVAATLDALGIGRAAVYGTHTGAAIGMALATRHPERVSTLVIDGLGVFEAAERAQLLQSYLPAFVPLADGTHLAWLWARIRDQFTFFPWNHRGTGARLWRELPPAASLHQVALDLLRAGDHYRAPYAAAFRYQAEQALPFLSMPTHLCARADDMLQPHLARLHTLPTQVHIEQLSAQRPVWGARIWALLCQGLTGLPDAPSASAAPLPAEKLGNSFVGAPGERLHLRGATGGRGLPLLLLHDSPGAGQTLDEQARQWLGLRPILMPDLPCHGESDVFPDLDGLAGLVLALHHRLRHTGLDKAELAGVGTGSVVARALAATHPRHYFLPTGAEKAADRWMFPQALCDLSFAPRADGGHLQAAWFHARDRYILGPTWQRSSEKRHDFGDDLDVPLIHRHALDYLKEGPQAPNLRAALVGQALAWRASRA